MSNLIRLRRKDTGTPWGFRLSGGTEMGQPLYVQKVVGGSLAYKAGMRSGDVFLQIGMVPAAGMSQEQAKMEILRSGNDLDFILNRTVTPICPPSPRMSGEPMKQVVEERGPFRGSPQNSPQLQSRSFKILQQQMGEDESDL